MRTATAAAECGGAISAASALKLKVGVLALQGAFREHVSVLQKLGVEVREIRRPEEMDGLDGLILPGGESTAMALIGEKWGIFPALQAWIREGKPVWGTCAGMILLSDSAVMQKVGGQALVGGMGVEICRNYFGSQIDSFEHKLDMSVLGLEDSSPYPAVFIRAPAIISVNDECVRILSSVSSRPCPQARRAFKNIATAAACSMENSTAALSKRQMLYQQLSVDPDEAEGGEDLLSPPTVAVAVRKGALLGTAFHPELTSDTRWHQYFLQMINECKSLQQPRK
jgi:5'-phosphate synthase pdxT subunit